MDELPSDGDLLRCYALSGAQADLAALVHRYVDLVYSAARRRLGDAHWAQDVTQQVFIVLMRKGRQLRPETVLASWLLTVTALECQNVKKAETRRARRERKVAQMKPEAGGQSNEGAAHSTAADWAELAPHVDAALDSLSAGDREAVVMRYFLNRSYGEAAAVLGASEGSVRQRVHRGLAKVRKLLGARGVITTEAALTAALLAHAVESAPATVGAATVAAVGSAAAGTTTAAGLSSGVLTIMSATSPMKFGIIATIILIAVGVTVMLLANRGKDGHGHVVAAAGPTTSPAPATMESPARPVPAAPVLAAVAAAAADAQAPIGPPRKIFDVITARSCDARQGPKDGFDHLAFINRGDWVEYDDVEFPPADAPRDMVFCAVLACPAIYAGSDIEVHVGAPDGPKIATLTVEPTAGYGDFVCQEAPVQAAVTAGGKQDIFLVFTGGGFNVRSIKFAVIDGRPADVPIAATGYTMAKKVNEGKTVLVQVRDGAWARYDWLQFPSAGADTFTLNYAVDAPHAGGVISVRLDLPTAAPICEIPIVATGGYTQFYTRTVALKQKVVGNHDVYLTFAGTDRGYFGLGDVAWFNFNAPGTAKLTPPPPAPVPTTGSATQRVNVEELR
jgi:RNA polymerase sigma factor (sigma-70 family)